MGTGPRHTKRSGSYSQWITVNGLVGSESGFRDSASCEQLYPLWSFLSSGEPSHARGWREGNCASCWRFLKSTPPNSHFYPTDASAESRMWAGELTMSNGWLPFGSSIKKATVTLVHQRCHSQHGIRASCRQYRDTSYSGTQGKDQRGLLPIFHSCPWQRSSTDSKRLRSTLNTPRRALRHPLNRTLPRVVQ